MTNYIKIQDSGKAVFLDKEGPKCFKINNPKIEGDKFSGELNPTGAELKLLLKLIGIKDYPFENQIKFDDKELC